MNISEAVSAFLQSRRTKNCRPETIQTYSYVLTYFARFLREQGVAFARDLSPILIEEYLAKRMSEGLRPSTVKNERGVAVMFCSYLSKIKVAPREDWKDVLSIRQDDAPPKVLTDDLCRELIQTIMYVRHYRVQMLRKRDLAILGVLLDAGLRASEVARLNLEDLNLKTATIYVSEESKSRRPRSAYMSKTTIKYIRRYLELRGNYAKRTNALFVTRHGTRIKYGVVYDLIVRISKLCGWHTSPHVLRHTNATGLVNSGMSLEDVRMLLGHAQFSTLQKYVHLANEDVRKRYLKVAPLDRLMEEDS